jgi:phosphoglycolate phosphatase-like HAD superfamily hydrolase
MQQAALVFDLDGTLVDSLPDLRAALNEMLRGLARRELSAGEVRRMIGDGTHALVGRALRATGEVVDLENAHQRFLSLTAHGHLAPLMPADYIEPRKIVFHRRPLPHETCGIG